MAQLTIEAHIISMSEDFKIADDLTSIHKYYSKNYQRVNYTKPKMVFSESRDVLCKPENHPRNKLYQPIKEMEISLSKSPVISTKWLSRDIMEVILSNFTRYTMAFNEFTGDVSIIKKDVSLCNKDRVDLHHVIITPTHMLTTYKDKNVIELFTTKNSFRNQPQEPFSSHLHNPNTSSNRNNNLDAPNMSSTINESFLTTFPLEPPLNINLASNHSNNLVLAWTGAEDARKTHNQVMAVYLPTSNSLELVATGKFEHLPLTLSFSKLHARQLLSLQYSHNTLHISYYNLQADKIKRLKSADISVRGDVVSCDWSNDENKVTFVTNEKRVYCFHTRSSVTRNSSTIIEAQVVTWNNNDHVIIVASSSGDFQFFDLALNALKILSHGRLQDVFSLSPVLKDRRIESTNTNTHTSLHLDRLLEVVNAVSVLFYGGPLVMMMIHTGVHTHNTHNSLHILNNHLRYRHHKQGLALLQALEWEDGDDEMVYCCLVTIVNHLMRMVVDDDVINDIQSALSKFFSPANQVRTLDYNKPIENLARRFFHILLRQRRFEKCYLLALDIKHTDLFMDLYYAARDMGETSLADVCRRMGIADDDQSNFIPDERDSIKSLDSMDSLYDSCYGDINNYDESEEEEDAGIDLDEEQSMLTLRRFATQQLHINDLNHSTNNSTNKK